MTEPEQPHDLAAERAVLGECLLGRPDVITDVRAVLSGDDWYNQRHVAVWRAIAALHDQGEPVTPVTVADRIDTPQWHRQERDAYLAELYDRAPLTAGAVTYHARIVRDRALQRQVIEAGLRLQQIGSNADPDRLAEMFTQIREQLAEAETVVTEGRTGSGPDWQCPTAGMVELDAFLEGDEPPYDWLVRGFLERRDRLILTGREGGGKSTLLRQICVQLAAGLHPFTLEPINPLRVLLVDLENSEAHTRRQLRPLRIAAGDRYKPEPGLHLRIRPEGLNLLDAVDAGWLADLTAAIRPDVLVTGPIYKLAGGDPTEEKTARHVALRLDRVRTEIGCAVLLEAHAPYASNGSKRPERPYGASLWSRWPEFGLFLSPEGHLRHWRGARDEREWPAALQRGGAWPWTVVTRPRDLLWSRIAELCADAGDQLSYRDLATFTGTSRGAVERAINEHRTEWEAFAAPDEEAAK
jgi:replicative DNA helicase